MSTRHRQEQCPNERQRCLRCKPTGLAIQVQVSFDVDQPFSFCPNQGRTFTGASVGVAVGVTERPLTPPSIRLMTRSCATGLSWRWVVSRE